MNAMKFFVAIALLAACAIFVAANQADNQQPSSAESVRAKRFPFAYPGAYPYAGYAGYAGFGYPSAYSSVLPAYGGYPGYGFGGYHAY